MNHDIDISKIQESPNLSLCQHHKTIRAGDSFVADVYGGVSRKTADTDYVEFKNHEGGTVLVPLTTIFNIASTEGDLFQAAEEAERLKRLEV